MINTAYKVNCDTLETESGKTIENGTLHVYDNRLKVHLNNEIKEVGLAEVNAWGRYDDTQYTSASSFAFTTAEFTLPNNAGNVVSNTEFPFYNGTKLLSENTNDVYIITIAFKAKINNANGHFELYLQGGNGTPYDRVKDIVIFPKGNNIEHAYAKTFQFYADADVVTNGLSIKATASDNGEIYDVIYFIQRTNKG